MSSLLIRWPKRLGKRRTLRNDVAHIVDVAPTIVSAASPPARKHGFAGIDLFVTRRSAHDPVFYEHQKSRAVRMGSWKLVNRSKSQDWELYNLRSDRTEQEDLATDRPDQRERLKQLWFNWAKQNHVKTK